MFTSLEERQVIRAVLLSAVRNTLCLYVCLFLFLSLSPPLSLFLSLSLSLFPSLSISITFVSMKINAGTARCGNAFPGGPFYTV
jgi:hypothetical protein